MPAVSVILPTCDRPHLLPRALGSILQQTWTDFEVLVVDANCRTPAVRHQPAMAGLLRDHRVRLIAATGSANAAQSRNRGLDEACGEWITYLDDDDAYTPSKIAGQMEAARAGSAPLVLCGYRVHLAFRQRTRQSQVGEFGGDALLLTANWGTPMLFHANDHTTRFNERLRAGEDANFAHNFILRHKVERVPNVPKPLIEVYPQAGSRVHDDFEAIWDSYRCTARAVRGHYSAGALRAYLLRGLLVRAQGGHGSWRHFLQLAAAVWKMNPGHDWRLAVNSVAYRTRLLRPFIVR